MIKSISPAKKRLLVSETLTENTFTAMAEVGHYLTDEPFRINMHGVFTSPEAVANGLEEQAEKLKKLAAALRANEWPKDEDYK